MDSETASEAVVTVQDPIISDSENPKSPTATLSKADSGIGDDSSGGSDQTEGGKTPEEPASPAEEPTKFVIVFNKKKYSVEFPLNKTVGSLKMHLETVIDVPPAMQKIMVRGKAEDDQTLRDAGIKGGAKVMVVGSTIAGILSVSTPTTSELKAASESEAAAKDPLSTQKLHKKIIDKGVPDDAMVGIKNVKESLPSQPLTGMMNKGGGKVRLTFKLENDQVWIGLKDRTDKISMSSIKTVISEPIKGHEEYHILGIQMGPTEASRYWIYWVPSQYTDAIKDTILGKFQYF